MSLRPRGADKIDFFHGVGGEGNFCENILALLIQRRMRDIPVEVLLDLEVGLYPCLFDEFICLAVGFVRRRLMHIEEATAGAFLVIFIGLGGSILHILPLALPTRRLH